MEKEKSYNCNFVKIGGNLTADARLIAQEVTRKVYAFTIANHQGDKVNFVDVVGELADALPKGAFVVVEGTLQQRKFETKEGEKRSVLQVRAKTVTKHEKKEKGEQNQVNVPMSAEAMLYFAEMARAFSVEQAWTSYKKPGTDGETPERGEQDTETPGAEIEEVEEPAAETAAQAIETTVPAQVEPVAVEA